MTKGSTWNIWDFHVHTPHSVLNNHFGSPELDETWNTYVDSLEKEAEKRNIVAIGITDYFTIEGYKRLRQSQAAGRLQNVLLIPNIEFRVDKLIYRTKDGGEPKRVNLHVLFSPEVSEREIEEGFLHDLDFVYENDPFESPRTRKLKIFSRSRKRERCVTKNDISQVEQLFNCMSDHAYQPTERQPIFGNRHSRIF